ncbi:hypothetical protein AAKU61_003888 [Undibacterium sp. GrIS 1.2]|uniref:hypothetical protein n=1 Tax=Undibacterium sp. GrIS 1.2 TaxID=3143933 RepID=UPI003392388E
MKYLGGAEVKFRDKVRLGDDSGGVVVCSIDTGEYTEEYPEEKWGYLKKGVVILFPKYGLIHYEEAEARLGINCSCFGLARL